MFLYVRFLGGDGSLFESAVSITGAHNEMDIALSEFGWLKSNRSGWRTDHYDVFRDGDRHYDVMRIWKGDQKARIYFDTTDYFGRL